MVDILLTFGLIGLTASTLLHIADIVATLIGIYLVAALLWPGGFYKTWRDRAISRGNATR